jgi:hypothetical protein
MLAAQDDLRVPANELGEKIREVLYLPPPNHSFAIFILFLDQLIIYF